MDDTPGSSQAFKRFLHAFFEPLTPAQWRDRSFDSQALAHLSGDEKHLAEEILLQHLEEGSTDPRVVVGLRDLRSQRAISALTRRVQALRGESEVLQPALALWQLAHAQEALAALIEALTCLPTFLGRIDAAICLRSCRCQQAAQALERALSDEAPLVRFHAARSLLILYAPWRENRADHPLANQMMSEDAQKREAASARILALIKKRPALPWCETGR